MLPQMFPGNGSPVADAICIAFIFIYAMGYSLGLGPAAWVYSSEVRSETDNDIQSAAEANTFAYRRSFQQRTVPAV